MRYAGTVGLRGQGHSKKLSKCSKNRTWKEGCDPNKHAPFAIESCRRVTGAVSEPIAVSNGKLGAAASSTVTRFLRCPRMCFSTVPGQFADFLDPSMSYLLETTCFLGVADFSLPLPKFVQSDMGGTPIMLLYPRILQTTA